MKEIINYLLYLYFVIVFFVLFVCLCLEKCNATIGNKYVAPQLKVKSFRNTDTPIIHCLLVCLFVCF